MKEETGHSRREVTPPLVIFDPSRSSSLSRDTSRRSFHDISGSCGDDISSHRSGNGSHKKPAKALHSPKKVSF